MQMVILCGGFATRLGNLSKKTPKSMIEIKGKPFLEYQIENLKKHSIKDIVLCVGHLSEQIENYFGCGESFGVNIRYSYDKDNPLGPIGALKNAESLLDNTFFIMYGDSYVFVDFEKIYSYFIEKNNLALMVVYQNFDKYDKSNLVVDNNFVLSYNDEKIKDTIFIDYGVSLFRKKTLDLIPKDTFYSTGDLFKDLVKQKQLLSYKVKSRFYHIGNPSSLSEFEDFAVKNLMLTNIGFS